MTIMKNKHAFEFDPHANPDKFYTVGNNRQVRRYTADHTNKMRVACYLHGHNIATFECINANRVEVFLTTCGFMTSTTRRAMNDFLREMGIKGRVSFAGGKMTVRYTDGPMRAREKDENQLGTLLFTVERNNEKVCA
jgi:hypothetical protein